MLYRELKCPYCEHDGEALWIHETMIDNHISSAHSIEFRTMKDLIASWKVLGMYEDRVLSEE